MDPRTLTRRDFVQRATALASIPSLPGCLTAARAASADPPTRWPGYAQAMVVDFLASPGYFNYPADPPLDAAMVRNAVESGITGVNLTVSAGDHEATVAKIARWEAEIERYPQALQRVRSLAQLQEAKRTGRLGIIYGFQDTVPIERDLGRLGVFADLGVKVIQLTYNVRNLVGDGCLEPSNAGLSNYGHQMVARLNELGILVDLSHCGQRTTADGILASERPVAISHTGCSAVAPHPRSKRDEELRMTAERGGVVGIYLMPFLAPGRTPTTSDVLAHIEHAIQVCGEDHVGIGSDLSVTPIDGSDDYWAKHREFVSQRVARGIAAPAEDPGFLFTVPELNSHRRMDLIADAMASRGHSPERIGKVLGANWVRLFGEVWKT
ncbi:MAG: membrane dipeptidase [Longimicrobiales bacterium]|nr:membrane dipeptidase [Longimicrobiales bacterium]